MSLMQLEQQIQLAHVAMEKASASGDARLKSKLRKELANFQKVLEKSKKRLKELELIKKQCDDLSACRDYRMKVIDKPAEKETKSEKKPIVEEDNKSYLEPIVIPWLVNKPKKEEEKPEERNDAEDRGMLNLAMSFGNQIITRTTDIASVSTLGSQVFGTSEITTAVNKEKEIKQKQAATLSFGRSRTAPSSYSPLRHFSTMEPGRDQPEEVETPLEVIRSFTLSDNEPLSAEHIAENELKAREKYIQLTKEHQTLRRSGVPENSQRMMHSQKLLRDCYAEIEYWECYSEEVKEPAGESPKILKSNTFLGRDPKKNPTLDVDDETGKARDAYGYAMMCHQALVTKKVSTTSEEWLDSQNRVNQTLVTLQYWEGRSAFSVPPSI